MIRFPRPVFEMELGIRRIVVGTELDPHIAELSVSAGLLLMPPLDVNLLADGFAIGDLRELQQALRTELAGKFLGDDFKMQFAQAAEDRFGGFHILANANGRILFHQSIQAGENLVFLACLLCIHGHGNAGGRELEIVKLYRLVGIAQGIAGCLLYTSRCV